MKGKDPIPCSWGKENEENAVISHIEKVNSGGKDMNVCLQCGFVVNVQKPWLGASPDCYLYDASEPTLYGIG